MNAAPRTNASSNRIGRYTLVKTLGQGGQGRVYEARTDDGRKVALKVLSRGEVGREARLGALLRHPNLVDVYETGTADGKQFLAMELCSGGTLAARAPLPPRALVDAAVQVCEALAYAHEELGLVHRDLKPENLLLDGGTVKVADLGIALADGDAATGPAGTSWYMSPEQASGQEIDARSDVFSLGVVLSVLASGELPLDVSTFASGQDDAERSVPAWLLPVVGRCLKDAPEQRFSSMRELAAALRALPVTGPTLAELVGAPPAAIAPEGALVGRHHELAALFAALDRPGVTTLKGPAGVGKSRLARIAAEAWPQSAFLCELSEVREVDGLVRLVAERLGVAVAPGREGEPIAQVGRALSARERPLLVLDGADHLVRTDVAARLAELAPTARILVTSRLSAGGGVLDLEPLPEDDAVLLLILRAAQRGTALADDSATRALARRLDGIPLALELAAGRLGVLSAQDLLDRLSLSFLRGAHSTLRATLEWGFDLLPPDAAALLSRLSVFAGGFTADAAVMVAHASPAALAALGDASLLTRRGDRLALLAPVAEHAAEKLGDRRDEAEVAHGRFYAGLAADEIADHCPPERACELENLLVACDRAVRRGDGPTAVACARGALPVLSEQGVAATTTELFRRVCAMPDLSPVERNRSALVLGTTLLEGGDYADAEALLETVDPADDPRLAADTAATLGRCLLERGRPPAAWDAYSRALDLAVAEGDRPREAAFLAGRAYLGSMLGRFERCNADAGRALVIARELSLPRIEAEALAAQAGLLLLSEGHAEAIEKYGWAIERFRELRMPVREAIALGNQALAMYRERDFARALPVFELALARQRAVGRRGAVTNTLRNLGMLHYFVGHLDRALGCLEEARREIDAVGGGRALAGVIGGLAVVQEALGRPEEAVATGLAALARYEALGDPFALATTLANLGEAQAALGQVDAALASWRRAEEIQLRINPLHAAQTRASIAGVLLETGRTDEACLLLDAAVEVLEAAGSRDLPGVLARRGEARVARGDPSGREDLDRAVRALEADEWARELVSVRLCRARALGDGLALEAAIRAVRESGDPPGSKLWKAIAAVPRAGLFPRALYAGAELRVRPDLVEPWSDERRAAYLLRPETPVPLSADALVWPASGDSPLPWVSVEEVASERDDRSMVVVYGVAVESAERLALVGARGVVDELVEDPRWTFLGWDVVDAPGAGISGLCNCGYQAAEKQAFASFAPLLGEHGLFTALADALAFVGRCDARVPEHAPFFAVGLWVVER